MDHSANRLDAYFARRDRIAAESKAAWEASGSTVPREDRVEVTSIRVVDHTGESVAFLPEVDPDDPGALTLLLAPPGRKYGKAGSHWKRWWGVKRRPTRR